MTDVDDRMPCVERDEPSAAFFDAASRGELLVKRSAGTDLVCGPEARVDPFTGSADLVPWVASGEGVLISWAVVHRAPLPILTASVPYVAAVVELLEGPWLMVRLICVDTDDLRAGMAVRARFVRFGRDGETLPVFEPAAPGQSSLQDALCSSSASGEPKGNNLGGSA